MVGNDETHIGILQICSISKYVGQVQEKRAAPNTVNNNFWNVYRIYH